MGKRVTIRHNADGSRTKRTTYTYKTLFGTKSETYTEKLPPQKKGCYVATAVYGSYDCPQVWVLRRFRDEHLERTRLGRLFIRCYYSVSPTFVRVFGNTTLFNRCVKKLLDKFTDMLRKKGYSDSFYKD